ncbi:AraC family ligand binding domain-containing protein [Lachnospiraceae bacterium C1.1]|nr:AraC family ligand binding domain-containing protein [Lachnospiraceae bacterium C1.1]
MNHEFFEYEDNKPYILIPIQGSVTFEVNERLFSHWHEELEIAYCLKGNARHFINGEIVDEKPGHCIVTNSEFMHSIMPDKNLVDVDEVVTYVLIIKPSFLKAAFPAYNDYYFINDDEEAPEEIKNVFEKLFAQGFNDNSKMSFLKSESLILELLYHMSKRGMVRRKEVDNINVQKDIERMKGVISFIKNHFRERIAVVNRFWTRNQVF